MTTVTIDLPEGAFSALRRSPTEFAREMRIAAAVQWYAEQVVSQEKAAEIAGLSRVELIDELSRRKVPVFQTTLDELIREGLVACGD
jgi:predicted HTH domain antitoxin